MRIDIFDKKSSGSERILELTNLDVRGFSPLIVAFHRNAPEKLKKGVMGAATACQLSNQSIDYTIKTYGNLWDIKSEDSPDREIIFTVTSELRESISPVIRRLYDCDPSPAGVGMIAAQTALARLESSIDGTILLVRLGFSFEALTVCRLILEQVAWSYAVHSVEEEKVKNIMPTKTISKLKEIFPYAGKLYGELSTLSHMNPGVASHYLEIKKGSTIITLRSHELSSIGAFLFMHVADIFAVISEGIFRPYFKDSAFVQPSNTKNGFLPTENRPTQIIFNTHKERMLELISRLQNKKLSDQ